MFQDFKPVLLILVRFLVLYLVFLAGYQFYLHYFQGTGLDPVSKWVAFQSAKIQDFLGYKTVLFLKFYKLQNSRNPFVYLIKIKRQWNKSVFWAKQLRKINEI